MPRARADSSFSTPPFQSLDANLRLPAEFWSRFVTEVDGAAAETDPLLAAISEDNIIEKSRAREPRGIASHRFSKEDFGLNCSAVPAFEPVDCKIIASWMGFDNS